MITLSVRNVNQALPLGMGVLRSEGVRIAPRGASTIEYPTAVTTVYQHPDQMVLFDPVRDANPFFHFFEALWILKGRQDVRFLSYLLPRMAEFSDDGAVFHAPYGFRLRSAYGVDQVELAVQKLQRDPDTRQVVLSIWHPVLDFKPTRDVPCNDMLMFKIREGKLRMSVLNRSNDVVLGAYGANVVQFSTLLLYMAGRIGVPFGEYAQVSDSYHVYEDNPYWRHIIKSYPGGGTPAARNTLYDSPVWAEYAANPAYMHKDELFDGSFDIDLLRFFEAWDCFAAGSASPHTITNTQGYATDSFINTVIPMWQGLHIWRNGDKEAAVEYVDRNVAAIDWREASVAWMKRRLGAQQ